MSSKLLDHTPVNGDLVYRRTVQLGHAAVCALDPFPHSDDFDGDTYYASFDLIDANHSETILT